MISRKILELMRLNVISAVLKKSKSKFNSSLVLWVEEEEGEEEEEEEEENKHC